MGRKTTVPARRVTQQQIYREVYHRETRKLKDELVPAIRIPLLDEDAVTPVALYCTAVGKVERNGRLFEYVDLRVYTVVNGHDRSWPT